MFEGTFMKLEWKEHRTEAFELEFKNLDLN